MIFQIAKRGSPVNSEEALALSKDRYGPMSLPTIVDIVTGWVKFVDEKGVSFSDCLLCKDDVSSAFSQFDIDPCSAHLLCMVLGTFLFVHIVGFFGWCGAPIVFAVFSRALARTLRSRFDLESVEASIEVFVDDVFCLALAVDCGRAQSIVQTVTRSRI